jgi:hypothetical protein
VGENDEDECGVRRVGLVDPVVELDLAAERGVEAEAAYGRYTTVTLVLALTLTDGGVTDLVADGVYATWNSDELSVTTISGVKLLVTANSLGWAPDAVEHLLALACRLPLLLQDSVTHERSQQPLHGRW